MSSYEINMPFDAGVSSPYGPVPLVGLFNLDQTTGDVWWKFRPREWCPNEGSFKSWNTQNAGKKSFTAVGTHGYFTANIFSRTYLHHRVVSAMMNGFWPVDQIDHRNGDRLLNRPNNLQDVTAKINSRSQKLRSDNTSGEHGISWNASLGKWQVALCRQYIGVYSDWDAAVAARDTAAIPYGFTSRHGR